MDSIQWYKQTVGTDTVNSVATKSGVPQGSLYRRLEKRSLTPELVVPIARAYGKDVLQALVTTGLITERDISREPRLAALRDATDHELIAELWRRLKDGTATSDYDKPLTDFGSERPPFEVYGDTPELTERKAAKHNPGDAL